MNTLRAAAAASIILLGGASPTYVFTLYSGIRGADPSTFDAMVTVSPFYSILACYSAGVLMLDEMNKNHPMKSFAGGCRNGERLGLGEIAERTKPQGETR